MMPHKRLLIKTKKSDSKLYFIVNKMLKKRLISAVSKRKVRSNYQGDVYSSSRKHPRIIGPLLFKKPNELQVELAG